MAEHEQDLNKPNTEFEPGQVVMVIYEHGSDRSSSTRPGLVLERDGEKMIDFGEGAIYFSTATKIEPVDQSLEEGFRNRIEDDRVNPKDPWVKAWKSHIESILKQ
jgi:hypothetical protein